MIQQLHSPQSFRRTKRYVQKQSKQLQSRSWLVMGWGLALLGLSVNVSTHRQTSAANTTHQCQQIIQSSAVLSRQQLAELLTIPERSPQQSVKDKMAEPYCQLPAMELRDGITAHREAYPLAFAPKTWLVMLYEEEEYAGFSFSFQQ